MALFDDQFLVRLEYLSLVSRRTFRGTLLAQRRSRSPGGGVEFADHRAYASGDDLRYVDWNVYARSDHLLLKRFHEEQDLHVYILLDCSPSMATREKFDHARRIAAALAYIALADHDRVSVLAFADDVCTTLPMTRGRDRIHSVMRFMEGLQTTSRATNLSRSLDTCAKRAVRPGPTVIVSDFYDPGGYARGLDRLRFEGFEPHVVRVFDPAEAEPALSGDVELVDVETHTSRRATITPRCTARYRAAYQRFVTDLHADCRRREIGCTDAPADMAYDALILAMMRAAGERG